MLTLVFWFTELQQKLGFDMRGLAINNYLASNRTLYDGRLHLIYHEAPYSKFKLTLACMDQEEKIFQEGLGPLNETNFLMKIDNMRTEDLFQDDNAYNYFKKTTGLNLSESEPVKDIQTKPAIV